MPAECPHLLPLHLLHHHALRDVMAVVVKACLEHARKVPAYSLLSSRANSINSCTTIDGDSQAWCATEVTLNSTMTSWGYCSTECPGMGYPDCRQGNTIPIINVFKTFRRTRTVRDCVEKCLAVTDCEYYKWKNHRKLQRRTCWLMKTGLITKKNFTSGPKYCNAE